ncbi:MAG: His/Gly/Thr/Pro-type tRNA ligase C-terminal domain-containing protein, partial [Promethearchaeota archaeon]
FNIIVDIFSEFGATGEQFQIYYNNRRFIDVLCKYGLKVSEQEIPMVYKIFDKSDKMEEGEFEKYVKDTFQEESVIQGIFDIKDSKGFEELLKKFNNLPEEFYSSVGYNELVDFQKLLIEAGISDYCTFSASVVRGLDYYTGIVFEVFDTGTENVRSIFGGGRYDDLLSIFSDEKITGIGFGMGILMFTLFLKTYDLIPEEVRKKDYTDTIYITCINEQVSTYAIELSRTLRDEDFPCIIDYRFKNLKNQLKKANELGVLIVLIIGPEEVEQNKVTIKNMINEEQKQVDFEEVIDEIYTIIDKFGES